MRINILKVHSTYEMSDKDKTLELCELNEFKAHFFELNGCPKTLLIVYYSNLPFIERIANKTEKIYL